MRGPGAGDHVRREGLDRVRVEGDARDPVHRQQHGRGLHSPTPQLNLSRF